MHSPYTAIDLVLYFSHWHLGKTGLIDVFMDNARKAKDVDIFIHPD